VTPSEQFIHVLTKLKTGELGLLRSHAGQGLDETVEGFDLFTGLWWPLRANNQFAPRRETAWLVAKLFGAFPIPNARPDDKKGTQLAQILGRYEPRRPFLQERYRHWFDSLLQTPLPRLEPHLRRALSVVADLEDTGLVIGIDWAQLLDDLSIWDRSEKHRRGIDVREEWACQYLEAAK